MPNQVVMPNPDCELLLPESASIPEWLHARTKGMGGSEVAALLGCSPYATAFDVFKNKVDDTGQVRFLGEEPVKGPKIRAELLTDNPVFEWGHRAEDMVRLKISDVLGGVPRSGGGLYGLRSHPLAIVTPDGILTKRRRFTPLGLIECKTSGESAGWDDSDYGPIHYQVQAQWQMGITGIHTCFLGCFVFSHEREFYLKTVTFDPEWFQEMVEIVEQFWSAHVLTGEPPMHDFSHPRTTDLLKELHPHATEPPVHLDEIDGAEEYLEAYLEAQAVLKKAEGKLEECKNWLKLQVGDSSRALLRGDTVVSWPEITARRIPVGKLREKFPDVAEALEETSTYRRFTVRRPKPVVTTP